MKQNYSNDINKLFLDFTIKNNINKKLTIDKPTPFNSKRYETIFFDSTNIYTAWRDYFLRHSIEYKLFMRYLKENQLYNKYTINLKKRNKVYYFSLDFINSGLVWDDTKEGFDFWANEAQKWRNFMTQSSNIINNENK